MTRLIMALLDSDTEEQDEQMPRWPKPGVPVHEAGIIPAENLVPARFLSVFGLLG